MNLFSAGSGLVEREESFFLERKNQRTSVGLDPGGPHIPGPYWIMLFASFPLARRRTLASGQIGTCITPSGPSLQWEIRATGEYFPTLARGIATHQLE